MFALQEWAVRMRVGQSALVAEIDPLQIAGSIHDTRLRRIRAVLKRVRYLPDVAESSLNRLVRDARKFDIRGGRFHRGPFERGNTHALMHDVWTHRGQMAASETYRRIAATLAAQGAYQHKKYKITREAQIVPLMQTFFLDLLNSMAESGYVHDKTSDFATGGIGKVIVWRDGSLWHENGATHRLAAARIVGLRHGFPMRIVAMHREWLAQHGIERSADLPKLPRAINACTGVLPYQKQLA